MSDITFLAAMILIGVFAACAVVWRSGRLSRWNAVPAVAAAYVAMLTSAFAYDVCTWQQGRFYMGSNLLGFLRQLVVYKSAGLVILSLLCLAVAAAVVRVRRVA